MTKIKTKKKKSLLRFSSFFCPDLGEEQKKKDLVRSSAQTFCPNNKGGGPWLNFAYHSEAFVHYWHPKGGGWHNLPHLNMPLAIDPNIAAQRTSAWNGFV